jgi:hypothetical protein
MMEKNEFLRLFREILNHGLDSEARAVTAEEVQLEAALDSFPLWDSIAQVHFIAAFDRRDIAVLATQLSACRTVGDLFELISRKRGAS